MFNLCCGVLAVGMGYSGTKVQMLTAVRVLIDANQTYKNIFKLYSYKCPSIHLLNPRNPLRSLEGVLATVDRGRGVTKWHLLLLLCPLMCIYSI